MASHSNWKALATVDFRWKQFVKEGNDISNVTERNYKFKSSISGDECRKIYEEVISSPASSNCDQNVNTKPVPLRACAQSSSGLQKTPKNYLQVINSLMKEAARNNVSKISELLDDTIELDITDQFGWTMLMCACHAGAIDVVRYLLDRGANVHIRDKSGNNCKVLAKRQGHTSVLMALESFQKHESLTIGTRQPIEVHMENFYCDVCKQHFVDTSRKQHNSSTVHLFNSHPRSSRTVYGIPEHNKGYQLLVKSGWNKEAGLGPDGAGNKFPLKTILKRDREGFGRSKQKSYVTHFKANSVEAVERHERKRMGIKHRISQIEKERHKERKLRRELNFS